MIVRWHCFRQQIERVDGSKLCFERASALALNGSYRAARADLEKAIALDKDNLMAHNNYAWLLATCPDGSVRDGKRAVEFARGVNQSLKPSQLDDSRYSGRGRG